MVAALDRDGPGVLNVVDDDPDPIRGMAAEMAEVLGAPPTPAAAARGGPARGRRMGAAGYLGATARGGQHARPARAGLAVPAPVVAGRRLPRADGAHGVNTTDKYSFERSRPPDRKAGS